MKTLNCIQSFSYHHHLPKYSLARTHLSIHYSWGTPKKIIQYDFAIDIFWGKKRKKKLWGGAYMSIGSVRAVVQQRMQQTEKEWKHEMIINNNAAQKIKIPVTVVLKFSWQIIQEASPIKFFMSLKWKNDVNISGENE